MAPDSRCAALAARQHGCIALAQARGCGLSEDSVRRRVRRGRWRRVLPAVYVLAGTPATWEQRLWAAILWGGPVAFEQVVLGFERLESELLTLLRRSSTKNRREPHVLADDPAAGGAVRGARGVAGLLSGLSPGA